MVCLDYQICGRWSSRRHKLGKWPHCLIIEKRGKGKKEKERGKGEGVGENQQSHLQGSEFT